MDRDLHGGEAWPDPRDAIPLPADPVPVERPKVVRLGHFRAVPAGVSKDVMRNAALILSNAHSLIRTGWCQLASALDQCNQPVEPRDQTANAWSIHGAMSRVIQQPISPNTAEDYAWRALVSVIWDAYGVSPEWLNDRFAKDKSQILDAFEEAIDLFAERLA